MKLSLAKIFAAFTNTRTVTLPNGSLIWYAVPKGERISVSYGINNGSGEQKTGSVILFG